MRKLVSASLCAMLLSGCASLDNRVVMSPTVTDDTAFVIDQTRPDDYPGYLAAEGNIYSCRYGIHHEARDEFSPSKDKIFAGTLREVLPGIASHRVQLRRFDVYVNKRLKMLNTVGRGQGGYIGYRLQKAGLVNADVYTFKKLLVDSSPMTQRNKNEHQVGCDDRKEGEYYSSEISGGHDVIVTWFVFDVDGKPYTFRSFYQYQPVTKQDTATAIQTSIQQTIEAIAPKLAI